MTDEIDIAIVAGHPKTFGWLRRKEYEDKPRYEGERVGEVWEAPDGKLTIFQPGTTPTITRYDLKKGLRNVMAIR